MGCLAPYEPLCTLKPVVSDVWLVDGPEVRMSYAGLRVPFATRATVVRLDDGTLWVHSPVALDQPLASALDELGEVGHLVAPNTLHATFMSAWASRWPRALSYGPPALIEAGRLPRGCVGLPAGLGEAWCGQLHQTTVSCLLFSETVFMHRPSRTLILTDLIQNLEADRVCPRWRWVMRACGCLDPDGMAPLDVRLSFAGRRGALRDAVRLMLSWEPERVLLAHGRPYLQDGAAEIRRAFRWVLSTDDR